MCINCGEKTEEIICQSCIGKVDVTKVISIEDNNILFSLLNKFKGLKDTNSLFLAEVLDAKLYPNSIRITC